MKINDTRPSSFYTRWRWCRWTGALLSIGALTSGCSGVSESGSAEPGANGAPGASTTSPTPTPAAMADNSNDTNGATSGAPTNPGSGTPASTEGDSANVPLAPQNPAPAPDAEDEDGNAADPAADNPEDSDPPQAGADDPAADPGADDPAADPGADDPADGEQEPPPEPPPPPRTISFGADVYPILVENCGRCHASGRLPNLASANVNTAFDTAVRESDEIVELISRGEMPADSCSGRPGSNGCVSVADFAVIESWVDAGRPR